MVVVREAPAAWAAVCPPLQLVQLFSSTQAMREWPRRPSILPPGHGVVQIHGTAPARARTHAHTQASKRVCVQAIKHAGMHMLACACWGEQVHIVPVSEPNRAFRGAGAGAGAA